MTQVELGGSPYHKFLGLELVCAEDGVVAISMPFRREFLRADRSDWLHGGIISALIDIAGDYAVATKLGGNPVPTIDLRVDYLKPATSGTLIATGRVVKMGRTIARADIELRNEAGQLVAVGRGAYAVPSG